MSKEALAKVVQRAISDGAFRRQLSTDPGTALRGFDLTPDESAAIRSGDSNRLSTLGVDLRMSKAFSMASDQATGDAARPVLSNDLGASYTGATTTGGQGSAGSSATTLAGQGSAGSGAATTVDPGSAGSSAHAAGNQVFAGSNALTSGDQGDNEPILSSGDNAGRDSVVIPGEPAHALGGMTSGDTSGTFGNVLSPGDVT
ncbi:MAG TPA: Os1348 family NHLP clan protein, partial [Candidatus Limnocylindrales bacterium]|nr:Os1348 family NHLP clan protein [Candidatus Limnocylindrales bacterium]